VDEASDMWGRGAVRVWGFGRGGMGEHTCVGIPYSDRVHGNLGERGAG